MPNNSTEFLEVEDVEFKRTPKLHRSRSGGYADHLEEKDDRERREREREMKEYYNSRYSLRQEERSDLLYVGYAAQRRPRPSERSQKKDEVAPNYHVREVKPKALNELAGKPVVSGELPIRERKPTIKIPKVEIHQEDPPSSAKEKETPKKSPTASPTSPSGHPRLRYKYSKLQDKLAFVETTCSKYLDVEAAAPQDLTFAKISEQVKGVAFDLQIWSHIANIEDKVKVDSQIPEAASRILDRLIRRVEDLSEACGKARPKDLKIGPLPQVLLDDSFGSFDDAEDATETDFGDVTESLGFVIESHLQSIDLQAQMLKTLTRSLQDATLGAKEEAVAVGGLVSEVGKFFGSQEAMDRYRIDTRFAGGKALEEARYAAGNGY